MRCWFATLGIVSRGWRCSLVLLLWGRSANNYWYALQTHSRLLLRVGVKVVDEWQVSLGYVRGSNIYVRGYLD